MSKEDDAFSPSELEEMLRSRFEVHDEWLIHHWAVRDLTPETAEVFISLVNEFTESIVDSDKKAGLIINALDVSLPFPMEVRRTLFLGLQQTKLSAVAIYFVKSKFFRSMANLFLRNSTLPIKMFYRREDAMEWLRKMVK